MTEYIDIALSDLVFIFSHFDWICCNRNRGCVYECVCVCQCKTSKMGFKLCNFAAEWVGVKKWGHFRGPIFSSTIILSSDYGNSQKIQNLRLSHFWHFFRFYTLRNFLSWISGHPLTFFLQYILATQNVYLCW